MEQVHALGVPSLVELGVQAARAEVADKCRQLPPGPEVDDVWDETIDTAGRSISVRIYRPAGTETLPVVVYLHGGGWVFGTIATSDAFCRRLATAAPCVVVSVEYRLAPEHPFPAGIEDAQEAILWTAEHASGWDGDAERIVVVGDSAGANLGTAAVRRLVDAGRPVVARQILAYPGTRVGREPSASPYGNDWPLTDAERAWCLEQYLPNAADRTNPAAAPLLAPAQGLPPTTILLAGCDPLAGEGLAYAEHLLTAGVSVDLHLYTGQIHGFLTVDPLFLPRSEEALGVVANAVRTAPTP